MSKDNRRWGMTSGMLVKAGAAVQARAMFYKAVVQAVLIYRSERWFITDAMMKVLEGFHHQMAWRTTQKTSRQDGSEGWDPSRAGGPGGGRSVAHEGVRQVASGYH